MFETEEISIAELADELGAYRSTLFKIVKRLGIHPSKRRDSERRNQQIAFVSLSDAEAIRETFFASRRSPDEEMAGGTSLTADAGKFYLIQLEPEYDPGRFKVGFTTDLVGRLRHHRCSAPFAYYKKDWPCRRTWERAAIDCVTAGAEQLHTEVFRSKSLDDVLALAEGFFSVMPKLDLVPEEDEDSSSN